MPEPHPFSHCPAQEQAVDDGLMSPILRGCQVPLPAWGERVGAQASHAQFLVAYVNCTLET